MLYGVGQAVGCYVHVCQHRRIRQQRAQGGVEKVAGAVYVYAACSQQAADDFRQLQALGDAEADAILRCASDPTAVGQAATYAEYAVGHEGNETTDVH
jgi:hypothetical protein